MSDEDRIQQIQIEFVGPNVALIINYLQAMVNLQQGIYDRLGAVETKIDALATPGDPGAVAKAVADLNAAATSLKQQTDALQAAQPKP